MRSDLIQAEFVTSHVKCLVCYSLGTGCARQIQTENKASIFNGERNYPLAQFAKSQGGFSISGNFSIKSGGFF